VAKIEKFPDTRLKLPIGLRFNYYLNDIFILKTYYRYYTDDFGMRAQTASIEVPIRLNQSFTLSPGFRYHTQSGTIYFYEFGQAEEGIDYFTSDYDLSAFESQKYGLALRYYPLLGISDFNMPLINSFTNLKRIDLKSAYYVRSNGFNAISISMGISFSMW
jgi:hypothetical protein